MTGVDIIHRDGHTRSFLVVELTNPEVLKYLWSIANAEEDTVITNGKWVGITHEVVHRMQMPLFKVVDQEVRVRGLYR